MIKLIKILSSLYVKILWRLTQTHYQLEDGHYYLLDHVVPNETLTSVLPTVVNAIPANDLIVRVTLLDIFITLTCGTTIYTMHHYFKHCLIHHPLPVIEGLHECPLISINYLCRDTLWLQKSREDFFLEALTSVDHVRVGFSFKKSIST